MDGCHELDPASTLPITKTMPKTACVGRQVHGNLAGTADVQASLAANSVVPSSQADLVVAQPAKVNASLQQLQLQLPRDDGRQQLGRKN